jgi:hypothetical protein
MGWSEIADLWPDKPGCCRLNTEIRPGVMLTIPVFQELDNTLKFIIPKI